MDRCPRRANALDEGITIAISIVFVEPRVDGEHRTEEIAELEVDGRAYSMAGC